MSPSSERLIKELKNLENTSHAKVNKMHDEKGKRPVGLELQDQEFQSINWVLDLLVDEFESISI